MAWWAIGGVFVAPLTLFIVWRFFYFLRNPKRTVSQNPDHILAPADGYVVYVTEVDSREPVFALKNGRKIYLTELAASDEPAFQEARGHLIGIYMTPFSVHYNRAPIAGYIRQIASFPPRPELKNLSMFNALSNLIFDQRPLWHDCGYLATNERVSFALRNEHACVYITQIADRWVRRIVNYRNNTTVEQGELFGLICLGSQVDLFVPASSGFEPVVEERSYVKAGISVLMRRKIQPQCSV
jgi:phosphatidylserine decarboxylase